MATTRSAWVRWGVGLVATGILAFVAIGIWKGLGPPRNARTERVVIARAGDFFLYAPLYVAIDGGYFAEEGLDVSLVTTGGDEKTWAAVISGNTSFGVADPTFVAISDARGVPGRVVGGIVNGVPFWGVTLRKDIKPFASKNDLDAYTVGSFPSPSTAFTLQRKMFLDAGKEPRIREGAFGTLVAMLRSGQVDIALELEPNVSQVVADGGTVVYSMSEVCGDFAITGLTATPEFLAKHPEIAQKVANGLQKALNAIGADRARALSILAKRFPEIDQSVAKAALDRVIGDKIVPRSLQISEDATNASFWAVDRRTHQVRFLRDLARFDKIIAFSNGTTSHGIAKRIYADANKPASIDEVEPGEGRELTLLTSSAVGTMALTPDLLGLDKLLADHPELYYVDLALGSTPEYNNVLVTALLSRLDVVREHPELVRGVLAAIQHAMLLVRFADSKVVKFAMEDCGESEARVTGALKRAADAQVFPATIEPSRAHWLNAARAAADAAGRPYNEAEHDRALHVFQSAVEPYQGLTRDAIRSYILPRLEWNGQDNQPNPWGRLGWLQPGALGLAGGTGLGAGLAAWLNWPGLALWLVLCAVGVWLTCRLPMNAWVRAIHLLWLLAALGIGVWWTASPPDTNTMLVVMPTWLGVEATIILAVAPLTRR